MSAVSSPTRRRHARRWPGGADCAAGATLAATALRGSVALGGVRTGVLLGWARAGVSRFIAGETGLLAARDLGAGVDSGFARAGAGAEAALGAARVRVGAAGDPGVAGRPVDQAA